MKQEPHFLVDDYLEKNQKELEKVMKAIEPRKLPPEVHKVKFLRELTLNLVQAQYKINHKEEFEKKRLKLLLEKRKQELEEKLNVKQEIKPTKQPEPIQHPIKQEIPLPPKPNATPVKATTISSKETNIDEFLKDPNVKEITCKGPDQDITVSYLNNETKTLPKINKQDLNHLIQNLAQKTQQEISPTKPFLASELNNKKIQANLGTDYLEPRLTIIRIE